MIPAAARERVAEVFRGHFAAGDEVGAAVAVWSAAGEEVHEFGGWRDARRSLEWERDTPVLVWSATKGVAAACALRALDEAGLELETRVVSFWPEFGAGGKSALTVGDVMSHRAGLAVLDEVVTDLTDHVALATALARQVPVFTTGHGYGPRTFGVLLDEFVRRLTGVPLARYWREQFADPLGLEFWIGMPEAEHHRVADILAPRAGQPEEEPDFAAAVRTAGSLTQRAFANPGGQLPASRMNTLRGAAMPSLGGIGTAPALAKFYALLATGDIASERMLGWMTTRLTSGRDLVLCAQTAFSAGFAMNGDGLMFGPSARAFGHPGAGGSMAFADPDRGVGFAYVKNQMEPSALPRKRGPALVAALFGEG